MPADQTNAIAILTLGDMIDGMYALVVCCGRSTPPCHHVAEIDVQWLADRVGRDYPCGHYSLVRLRWRCSACGGRRVSFRMLTLAPHVRP